MNLLGEWTWKYGGPALEKGVSCDSYQKWMDYCPGFSTLEHYGKDTLVCRAGMGEERGSVPTG